MIMMSAASTPTRGATLMTAEKSAVFFFGVSQTGVPTRISICQVISIFFLWKFYTRSNVRFSRIQRAALGRNSPTFRSDTPICEIFATSSDFHMASNFPESQPNRPPIGPAAYAPLIYVKRFPRRGPIGKKMFFIFIIPYFFIKVKSPRFFLIFHYMWLMFQERQ